MGDNVRLKQETIKIVIQSGVKLQSLTTGSDRHCLLQALTLYDIEQLVQTAFHEGRKHERSKNRERND